MDIILYILVGLVIGLLLGWLAANARSSKLIQSLSENIAVSKSTIAAQLQSISEKNDEAQRLREDIATKTAELNKNNNELATANATAGAQLRTLIEKHTEIQALKDDLARTTAELNKNNNDLATAAATNNALLEKLARQKQEIEELGTKFTLEFENIANKILETKTEKFTELNKNNLKGILEPLGITINEFKKTVNDTYDKESKERFSLGEKVKELSELNIRITQETKNLTNALRGDSKTQGQWGEMILESILEKSGLRKDEQYFLQNQLTDVEGNVLRSDSENKKMRPDALIKYPDKRTIIIDSKVSLSAFTKYLDADDALIQKSELDAHVQAVKNHVLSLSTKGYDDYDKTLDFVMMFIPSEPAYMAALQSYPELWNFAYEKRILLINPTNLIVSLKLIVDLWKREYQNKNAQDIAERGAKLYDKFVGFVENLSEVGKYIGKSQDAYTASFNQLSRGKDNLVLQAEKLRALGLKNKKDLPLELAENAILVDRDLA